MSFEKVHDQFDISNPEHRAAYIAGAAGFLGPGWDRLDWEDRVRLGRAIQEEFPGVEHEDLIAKLQGIDFRPLRQDLLPIWATETDEQRKARREAIRTRALEKVALA